MLSSARPRSVLSAFDIIVTLNYVKKFLLNHLTTSPFPLTQHLSKIVLHPCVLPLAIKIFFQSSFKRAIKQTLLNVLSCENSLVDFAVIMQII